MPSRRASLRLGSIIFCSIVLLTAKISSISFPKQIENAVWKSNIILMDTFWKQEKKSETFLFLYILRYVKPRQLTYKCVDRQTVPGGVAPAPTPARFQVPYSSLVQVRYTLLVSTFRNGPPVCQLCQRHRSHHHHPPPPNFESIPMNLIYEMFCCLFCYAGHTDCCSRQ